MKRLLCALLVCALCVTPALAENPDTGSWSQINQAVGKGEGWTKLETDDTFHLGEKKPLEGYDDLFIGDWGTYPSMDGSTAIAAAEFGIGRAEK